MALFVNLWSPFSRLYFKEIMYLNVVKKHITHDDYKNCLLNREEQMRKMNVIRSHLHDVYTEEVNKVALSAEDDKRVIMEDGIHTLAYGHYRLKTEGGARAGGGISWIYIVREFASSGNGKNFQNCHKNSYCSSWR